MTAELIQADNSSPATAAVAIINGEELSQFPEQLYVPVNSLHITLQAFEGPLDLLLYLIKKDNINILDIPIASIAEQYLFYVQGIDEVKLDLIADYLVMAAYLAEIKSKMLLPTDPKVIAEEEDPRAELVKRLQEYEKFKEAALKIDELPRQERDIFNASPKLHGVEIKEKVIKVGMEDLLSAFKNILMRVSDNAAHHIRREVLSVREKMTFVLSTLSSEEYTHFDRLFNLQEGKMGVVVTFMALLELVKQSLIELVQEAAYQPIQVKKISC